MVKDVAALAAFGADAGGVEVSVEVAAQIGL